ncbi:Rho guanine nucleotide exchange factor [Marasmius sp. AFHP31]|nr:Rho guanine nucleotide exchange factor [Marasmius sp. AFHP31]
MANFWNPNLGDHNNLSSRVGTQINNHQSGSGTQNNNNSTGSQNINYGRDQNFNNGPGGMTVNNKGPWNPQSSRTPSSSPGYGHSNNNNNRGGTQNINNGRDHNANNSSSDFTVNNDERVRKASPPPAQTSFGGSGRKERPTHSPSPSVGVADIAKAQSSSGKSFSAEELAKKVKLFKRLVGNQAEYQRVTRLAGNSAQSVLDNWQLMSERVEDADLRSQLLRAMIELSGNAGLFPQCLEIRGVEEISKRPVFRGGFADIYTGKRDGVKVAVKVICHKLDSQNYEQLLKTIIREAMVWRTLDHPNISPFTGMYWFDKEQGEICLVSPWVENGNLLEFVKKHDLDPARKQKLASISLTVKDIAQGLAYLHGREPEITHGDLKGHNVLISADFTARVTDFGLSRFVNSQRLQGLSNLSSRQLGATRWLAPELLKAGRRSAMSPESDVYAFGCVCYEIYAKKVPFEDVEEWGITPIVVDQNKRPELPQEVSNEMRQMIQKCWHAEPGLRPKAAGIVEEIGDIDTGMQVDTDSEYESAYESNM